MFDTLLEVETDRFFKNLVQNVEFVISQVYPLYPNFILDFQTMKKKQNFLKIQNTDDT